MLHRLLTSTLTRIGAHLTSTHIGRLDSVVNYLEAGRWLNEKGFEAKPRYATREDLYKAIAERIRHEQVVYLEFGVYKGKSLKEWSKLLNHPRNKLFGFDSFEGLPEQWNRTNSIGAFSLHGNVPVFDDSRIVLHKGWFEETLPRFVVPPHERLVINLDADLYSSSLLVLRRLRSEIRPGTILIFDEFVDRNHELKAFDEFLTESALRFRFLACTKNLVQVAFECVPNSETKQR